MYRNLENYILEFSQNFLKNLHTYNQKHAQEIINKIKKLKSAKYNIYRLRVGNYRIIYQILPSEKLIYILTVGHRKDIYNQIKHLQ